MTIHTAPGRLAGRVCRLLERTSYAVARTEDDREAVFRLRYEAYRREGGIEPNPHGRFTDALDESHNAVIITMKIDGELASSIRLHIASPASPESPSAAVFGDILAPRLAAGQTIVDPTRHVANLEITRRFPDLPYLTVRSAWMAAAHFSADHILAAVRSEHKNFYKRIFGHQEWSDERPYPMLAKPIICLGLDYPGRMAAVEAKYPFYASTVDERTRLFG